MKSRAPRSAALRTARAVLVAVLMVGSFVLPADVANAGIGLGVTPTFPATVEVGDQNVAASVQIVNQNTPPNDGESNTLLAVLVAPACGDPFGNAPCPAPFAEPGVFLIDLGSAVGAPGTACAGIGFTVTGPDATGTYTFTPNAPVVLGPPGTPAGGDRCVINFTFDVAMAPAIDVNPGLPGRQTFATARANARGNLSNILGFGGGAAEIGVSPTTALLGTVASAAGQTVTPGTPVTDTATVTGLVGSPVPTGTVTFTLRGPGGCAGPVVGAPSTVPLVGGAATSPPFAPTIPGTYNFTATFSGDANFDPILVPVGCGVAGEMFTVAEITPVVATVASTQTATPGSQVTDTATVTAPPASRSPPAP